MPAAVGAEEAAGEASMVVVVLVADTSEVEV